MIELIIIGAVVIFVIRHRFYWKARKRDTLPKFMAHRGIKTHYPENSIPAYQEAVHIGFEAIEMDIVSTKDDQLVCSHNFDLERETSGEGWIHAKSVNYLKLIKTGIYSHPDNQQSIPTFLEAITQIPRNTFLNIEIKTQTLFDLSTAKCLKNLINNNQIEHPFMVSSFNPIVVLYYRLFVPSVSVGFILENIRWLWVLHWIHPDYFHPRGDLVTGSIVQLSKKHQLPLNVWTVNTHSGIKWCLKHPIQSIITDNPRPFYD